MELSQDLGHRPIVFIRFNPDAFKKNNVLISSCWSYNQHGACKIKKSKEKEWEERLATLQEHINYWINPENVTEKTIETIQLFYDM
jgi:Holliday junction resolvasome RuvABC endonuclease subunit